MTLIEVVLLSLGLWFLGRKIFNSMNPEEEDEAKKDKGKRSVLAPSTSKCKTEEEVKAGTGQRKDGLPTESTLKCDKKKDVSDERTAREKEEVQYKKAQSKHRETAQGTSEGEKKEAVCDKIIKRKEDSQVMKLLSEKASLVKVDRQLLDKANRMFDMKVATWKEFTFHDIVTGIKEENMEKYRKGLVGILGPGIISYCEKMKYGSSTGNKVEIVKFEVNEFTSAYGFQATVRERDGTITAATYVHRLQFKLAPDWNFGTGERFSAPEIHAIKQTFGKLKCLEELKKEGIISDITYITD